MKMKRKLEDFGELSAAEQKIVDELDSGGFIKIHNGLPPETGGDYDVRATFIRYLALGGCKACRLHEKGLRVKGARIVGNLSLEGGVVPRDLGMQYCRFLEHVVFSRATLKLLNMAFSNFHKGLDLSQSTFERGLNLKGVLANNALNLMLSKIDQRLEMDGVKVSNTSGYALNMGSTIVVGIFSIIGGAKLEGKVELAGATIDVLCDEKESWSAATKLSLDGFVYNSIVGLKTYTTAIDRLKWLSATHQARSFSPQPYEQLAKVLREMGHREDARVVLIEKERLQRAAQNPEMLSRARNWVFDKTSGYGYQPWLSLRYLAGLMVIGMLVFGGADLLGAVKPNSARVWHLSEWEKCVDNPVSPKWCYLLSDKGESYPAFNPFIYSVDTLLPIVDLEMQGAWIPDDRASLWGVGARVYLWLHIALGWFFSLLAVAGFSGLIKPE